MLLLELALVALCLLMLRAAYRGEWLLACPTHFIALYFLMIFFGLNSIYSIGVDSANSIGLTVRPSLIITVWVFPVAFCLASLAILSLPRLRRRPRLSWVSPSGKGTVVSCIVMLILGAVLFGLYWRRLGSLPILMSVQGTIESTSELRRASTMLYSGLLRRIWLIFCRYMLVLVSLSMYIEWRVSKTRILKAITVISVCLTSLVLIADTQKAQLVFFMFQLFLVESIYRYIEYGQHPSIGRYVPWTAAALLVVIGLYVCTMDIVRPMGHLGDKVGYAIGAIIRRTTITQALPLVVIFGDVPDCMPLLLGATWPNWGVLPHDQFDLSQYAFWRLYGIPGGAASTLFLGETYANWGLGGMIVAILGFSMAMPFAHILLMNRCKNAQGIATYAFLSGYLMRLAITQVSMGLGLPLFTLVVFRAVCLFAKTVIPVSMRPTPLSRAGGYAGFEEERSSCTNG